MVERLSDFREFISVSNALVHNPQDTGLVGPFRESCARVTDRYMRVVSYRDPTLIGGDVLESRDQTAAGIAKEDALRRQARAMLISVGSTAPTSGGLAVDDMRPFYAVLGQGTLAIGGGDRRFAGFAASRIKSGLMERYSNLIANSDPSMDSYPVQAARLDAALAVVGYPAGPLSRAVISFGKARHHLT